MLKSGYVVSFEAVNKRLPKNGGYACELRDAFHHVFHCLNFTVNNLSPYSGFALCELDCRKGRSGSQDRIAYFNDLFCIHKPEGLSELFALSRRRLFCALYAPLF
jgi:hypothetical protein